MKCITSKVLILGAQGVGKSSLALRLADQHFKANISPTVGVSYLEAHEEVGDHVVRLQIWDTAGQERFKSMIPMYYRNSSAALLVYDVTDAESFHAVQMWEEDLRRFGNREMVIYVVGNKYDIEPTHRRVDKLAADAFAEAIGGHFREVSALSNQGTCEMRLDLCVKLIHRDQNSKSSAGDGDNTQGHSLYDRVQLEDAKNNQLRCCS